jgi:hypothetical protein
MWLSILSSDQQVLGGVAKLLDKRPLDAEASLSSAGLRSTVVFSQPESRASFPFVMTWHPA